MVAEQLDPDRLEGLDLGIDEVVYRRGHRYLPVITHHVSGKTMWTAPGRDADTAGRFFDEFAPRRARRLAAVSMDMSPAYAQAAAEHARQVTICWDPFHVVAVANKALDEVRRAQWHALRVHDQRAARKVQGRTLGAAQTPRRSDRPAGRRARQVGGPAARPGGPPARGALGAVFAGELDQAEVADLLDRWLSRAQRSRMPESVERPHHPRAPSGILEAIRLGLTNAPTEAQNKVRLITCRPAAPRLRGSTRLMGVPS